MEKPIDDTRRDRKVDDQEPEKEFPAHRALLRFDLHAQDGVLGDVFIDALFRFPEAETLRGAHGLDGVDDLAFGEQRDRFEWQRPEPPVRSQLDFPAAKPGAALPRVRPVRR
jgi:hypothetical protein